jgi:hypothetical protein
MKVGLLTLEQKNLLQGQYWTSGVLFNPIQDDNDNWILSTEEMYGNTNPTYSWVEDLPLIDHLEKVLPNTPLIQ